MGKFDSELMRVLMKRLPNRLDYVVSHRIEGAVELREITTGHDRVVIIIRLRNGRKSDSANSGCYRSIHKKRRLLSTVVLQRIFMAG